MLHCKKCKTFNAIRIYKIKNNQNEAVTNTLLEAESVKMLRDKFYPSDKSEIIPIVFCNNCLHEREV